MNLKERLKRLKREKESRPKSISFRKWRKEREYWFKYYKEHPGYDAPAGEIANIIDGLTPSGYNKEDRKVSFVERGGSFTKPSRLSSRQPVHIGRR